MRIRILQTEPVLIFKRRKCFQKTEKVNLTNSNMRDYLDGRGRLLDIVISAIFSPLIVLLHLTPKNLRDSRLHFVFFMSTYEAGTLLGPVRYNYTPGTFLVLPLKTDFVAPTNPT